MGDTTRIAKLIIEEWFASSDRCLKPDDIHVSGVIVGKTNVVIFAHVSNQIVAIKIFGSVSRETNASLIPYREIVEFELLTFLTHQTHVAPGLSFRVPKPLFLSRQHAALVTSYVSELSPVFADDILEKIDPLVDFMLFLHGNTFTATGLDIHQRTEQMRRIVRYKTKSFFELFNVAMPVQEADLCTMVHCDLSQSNIGVRHNTLYVLDWDFVGFGDRAWDIASVLSWIVITSISGKNGDTYAIAMQHVLSRYIERSRERLDHVGTFLAGLIWYRFKSDKNTAGISEQRYRPLAFELCGARADHLARTAPQLICRIKEMIDGE